MCPREFLQQPVAVSSFLDLSSECFCAGCFDFSATIIRAMSFQAWKPKVPACSLKYYRPASMEPCLFRHGNVKN